MAVGRAYHSSLKPLLLLAYEGDALAGVVALAADKARKANFLSGRKHGRLLRFRLPAAASVGIRGSVFAELARLHLPILRLANLPADSATSRMLQNAAEGHGYLVFSRPAYRCAQIPLGSRRSGKS